MELTAGTLQEVAAGQAVRFTETPVRGSGSIVHRDGAGIVTLRGQTTQFRALYRVSFNGNIEIPTGGTVGPISVAIAVSGEPLSTATAIVTPAAVENFFNVSLDTFVAVPQGCCTTVSIVNTSTQAIDVQNATLIALRVG